MKIFDVRNVMDKRELKSYIPKKKEGAFEGMEQVVEIIKAVRQKGDEALVQYTKSFEGCQLKSFAVSAEEFLAAEKLVTSEMREIIKEAAENIRLYHKNQIVEDWSFSPRKGVILGQKIKPIERVGLYIPGGKAAYPSTLLMNAIPAILAGVKEIAVFTPPNSQGKVNPLVLYTANLLGIREIYKLGGAQAIAAAAYGTEQIPTVDKILGPGNRYVAMAKKLVYGDVAIDMIAGPSEVLIIADKSGNKTLIAADILAQGEHDEDAGLYLITDKIELASEVEKELGEQLKGLEKKEIAGKAVKKNLTIYLTRSTEQGLALSNLIAPEHLELMVEQPFEALKQVNHAGSVFLGANTPEALGDYFAGTNHTLPTNGTARFSSPLGVYDFIKRPSFIHYTKQAFELEAEKVAAFAKAEGLDAHRNSILLRMEKNR